MWRRVASQSPQHVDGSKDAYVKAFTALGKMLREGRSLSGHERNCCFLNTRDGRFATISSASGLDFADDGRALGLTDWDHDGDVDIWLSNRTGPRLRFMRNDRQGAASFVTFKLWGTRCNRDAVGARLELNVTSSDVGDRGKTYKLVRTVRAGRGFMSQASKRIHFGVGRYAVEKLVVRWPDGGVEQFDEIQPGCHYEIKQGRGVAELWTRPGADMALQPLTQEPAASSSQSRIVITGRLPMPEIDFTPFKADSKPVPKGPRLINLWATDCVPCIEELKTFCRQEAELRRAGVHILALNVDQLMDDPHSDLSLPKQILSDMAFPFTAAAIDSEQAGTLDLFHQAFLSLRRPLPIPSSFLTTADGQIAVIYRGPVTVEQLLQDLELLDAHPAIRRNHAVPFAGKWHSDPIRPDPHRHATAFMRNGFVDQGAEYLEAYLTAHLNKKGWGPRHSWPSAKRLASLCDLLADFYRLQDKPEKVVGVYRVALRFDPDFVPSLMNLGKINIGQGRIRDGLRQLQRAHQLAPSDPLVASDLAIAYAMTGRFQRAEQIFLNQLKQEAASPRTRLFLGRLYMQSSRFTRAAAQYREYLKHDPNSAEALQSLCWILISSPNDTDRNLQEARPLLQRLVDQASRERAELHDIRAAIHAELGNFGQAISNARRALVLARQAGNGSSVDAIRKRLELYRNRRVYRLR